MFAPAPTPSTSTGDASTESQAREGSPEVENRGDAEGEGEENEDVLHSTKCKVYKLTDKGGKKEWADLGVGYLKIKKDRTTGKHRLLCRNEASARVTIVSLHFLRYLFLLLAGR